MRKTLSSLSRQPQTCRPAGRAVSLLASAGLALTLSLALLPVLPAESVAAQSPQCGAREALLDRLSTKYEEQPVSLGVTATGSLLEVLASPSGSWTIIVTIPGGPTCLVSSGEGWRMAPVQVAQDPAV